MGEAGDPRGTGTVGGSGTQQMYVACDAEPSQIGEDWWVYFYALEQNPSTSQGLCGTCFSLKAPTTTPILKCTPNIDIYTREFCGINMVLSPAGFTHCNSASIVITAD